jgi:hypothetical protein
MIGGSRQLFLVIQLDRRTVRAIIDSSVTGNFINTKVVKEQGLGVWKKPQPYRLFTINSREIETEKGIVTHKTRIL